MKTILSTVLTTYHLMITTYYFMQDDVVRTIVTVMGASAIAITSCFHIATGKDKMFYLTDLFNN